MSGGVVAHVAGLVGARRAGLGLGVVDVRRRCPGAGSRGTRTGRPSRSLSALGGAPGDGPVAGRACRKWKKKAETTAAIGMPKIAPGMPAIRDADEHRAEDHDRVDADGALHDPRLEDVHHHEPAGGHQRSDRQDARPA